MSNALRNMKFIDRLPFTLKPMIDITDTLPQRPNPEPYRSIDQIKRISVHHSAVEGQGPQQYADYHVNVLKWPCIGYHTVIKVDQAIQTNDWLTFSYHTSSNNYDTVSVSISGDLSKRPLSEVERNTLYGVLLTYLNIFPNTSVDTILGHNEYPNQNTACPCLDMNKLRDDIAKLQLQMKAVSDPAQVKVNVYKATEQHRYLYNQYVSDPVANKWLEPHLLKLHEVMKENGMYFNG